MLHWPCCHYHATNHMIVVCQLCHLTDIHKSSPVASRYSKVSIVFTVQNSSKIVVGHLGTFCLHFNEYCEFGHTSFVITVFHLLLYILGMQTTTFTHKCTLFYHLLTIMLFQNSKRRFH